MNILVLGLMIFVISLFILELFSYAFRIIRHPDRQEIRKRLSTLESYDYGGATTTRNLLKMRVLSDVPFLNRVLPYIPGAARLDFMIKQANLKYTLGFFALCSMLLGLTGYLLGSVLTGNLFLAILMASALTCLPFYYVRIKKKKRMAEFERQLPEGLGLITRALRAGHAFTSAMKFASDEIDDPLGPEFAETLAEINYGVNVTDALKNLTTRVDCPDLSFFVVSVILQRDTGGNLAEILESIAQLIRERFKFRGKVKTLTAEGRLTAGVLIAIPFALFGFMFLMSRAYVEVLLVDPFGKAMLAAAGLMIILGIFIIRRIINVDV